jgi:hypothetical protein
VELGIEEGSWIVWRDHLCLLERKTADGWVVLRNGSPRFWYQGGARQQTTLKEDLLRKEAELYPCPSGEPVHWPRWFGVGVELTRREPVDGSQRPRLLGRGEVYQGVSRYVSTEVLSFRADGRWASVDSDEMVRFWLDGVPTGMWPRSGVSRYHREDPV